MRFAISWLVLTLAAYGQITATMLRAKYGTPVYSGGTSPYTEIFKVRGKIEMLVTYGSNEQACRIDLPRREQPVGSQASTDAETNRQLHEVLDEVVPPSMRGRELTSIVNRSGLRGGRWTEYENLTIVEVAPQIQLKFKDCERSK